MSVSTVSKRALVGALALLSACGQVPPVDPARARAPANVPTVAPILPAEAAVNYATLEAYKRHVAEQIMRNNPGKAVQGALPPILPAIVVLRITIDRNGDATTVAVQRSRNEAASAVAVASVRQSGRFAKPLHLISFPASSLSFSETFLFADAQRFRIRTLDDGH
jgi:protein TonB